MHVCCVQAFHELFGGRYGCVGGWYGSAEVNCIYCVRKVHQWGHLPSKTRDNAPSSHCPQRTASTIIVSLCGSEKWHWIHLPARWIERVRVSEGGMGREKLFRLLNFSWNYKYSLYPLWWRIWLEPMGCPHILEDVRSTIIAMCLANVNATDELCPFSCVWQVYLFFFLQDKFTAWSLWSYKILFETQAMQPVTQMLYTLCRKCIMWPCFCKHFQQIQANRRCKRKPSSPSYSSTLY